MSTISGNVRLTKELRGTCFKVKRNELFSSLMNTFLFAMILDKRLVNNPIMSYKMLFMVLK